MAACRDRELFGVNAAPAETELAVTFSPEPGGMRGVRSFTSFMDGAPFVSVARIL
jgi:hypothetical protein